VCSPHTHLQGFSYGVAFQGKQVEQQQPLLLLLLLLLRQWCLQGSAAVL
jgi:hypothetical protein